MTETAQLCVEQTGDGLRIFGSVIGEAGRLSLQRALHSLHDRVLGESSPRCRLDVSETVFANSSAIGEFVHWISRAEEFSYKVYFVLDPAITWQRINFSALKSLAPGTVFLEHARNSKESDQNG